MQQVLAVDNWQLVVKNIIKLGEKAEPTLLKLIILISLRVQNTI